MYIAHKTKDVLSFVGTKTLKKFSFIVSLLSCLVSGSILLFTLYTPKLHEIGLSYLQINLIASVSAGGMYFCLPVLGYLSDCFGPPLLSLLSIVFFVPSYLLNSYLVHNLHYELFCITFCCIGIGTSSLYFASLLTCARIYPDKGFSISLPITCYGLSALVGSQFVTYMFDDLSSIFVFFAVLYFIIGILNFVAASTELEVLLELELEPLTSIEPINHKERYLEFLKNKSTYILLFSLILNVGPLESYQNNLSTINPDRNLSHQVGLFALSSTISRLLFGGLVDYFHKKYLLILVVIVGMFGQWFNNVICNGVSYGGLFTIYPTILASKWGVDLMGSTWGSFMVAPAFGSIIFSILYGKMADLSNLLSQYFTITSGSILISCLLIISLKV